MAVIRKIPKERKGVLRRFTIVPESAFVKDTGRFSALFSALPVDWRQKEQEKNYEKSSEMD
jgi:hypothetical protein